MNEAQPGPPAAGHEITTLVDHHRDGRFVVAFCPICDHVEEAKDGGQGRNETTSLSVAKIKVHIHKRHPAEAAKVKISVIRRA